MKILKVFAIILTFSVFVIAAGAIYVNLALPNVGTPTNVLIQATDGRLARGKYLANHVSACMDCHSTRNWNLYSGPLQVNTLGEGGELFDENMGFPGKIYASNITPYALASWSDGEILKAVTTGQSKDGRALFPLMGYHRFGRMDQEDIYSIIVYIRSIKGIKKEIPATSLNFPVNLINKTMPMKSSFTSRPSESDTVRYGGYLVNAAGCVDCHSKTDKGNIVKGSEFGGGMEFKYPTGTLRSPNITPHKINGIGNWTEIAFVEKFKSFRDSTFHPAKVGLTHYNTPMPWTMFAGMTDNDLSAIYTYLHTLKANPNKVEIRTPY
jgi:mono/diheme cytochrome c family protein